MEQVAGRSVYMECLPILNMKEANLCRTKYLLSRYHEFVAQSTSAVDTQVSSAVLDILGYHFLHRDVFTQDDQELIDRCGVFLVSAIDHILQEIRNYPYEIVEIMFPVLFHFYFSPDGKAVNLAQLADRLQEESLFLTEEALCTWLDKGERAFAALLFPNRMVAAISAWH